MIRRKIADADLEECLAVNPAAIGQEIVGRERALIAWRRLLRSPSFNCVVIEMAEAIAAHRIVAFAASVFVSEGFANSEICEPRPGLNGRIISSIDAGRPVVLSEAELRYGNTYDGLSQVILYSTWRKGRLTPELITEVELEFAKSYFELHAGYQVNRLLFEATNAIDIEHAASTRVWRFISDFTEFRTRNPDNTWNQDRALALITKTDPLGPVAAFLFDYRKPVLRFRKADQQMLAFALEGLTDEELARALHLSLQAIKKRWASAFAHVGEVMPDLLPSCDDGLDRATRGRQKRHHLLAYLRHHPEEVRPILVKSTRFGRLG
jgi:hypothetical protein